jgi:predicted ATPase
MYRFRDCEVDPQRREIRCAGRTEHLEPQAFDLLVHLIEHRDRVVPKIELLDGVWGHHFLSDANLTTRIKEARRAVGDDGTAQHTIANVRGRGYRFVADLTRGLSTVAAAAGLIGRDADFARLETALKSRPLVTLIGPGGVGKTTLARSVLTAEQAGGLDCGHFVDLAELAPGTDVLPALAHALSVTLDPTHPRATTAAIAGLHALVVLDNCEHVADSVADVVERIVSVPGRAVRLLATSRARLGLTAEWLHDLAPLDPTSARRLFEQRAGAARGSTEVDGPEPARLDAMLAGLDRLPLTIEMAAARLRSMTFDDVERGLATGAPVLQLSHRSTTHRHRNLASIVGWSADLLSGDERQAFEDFSVFAGAVGADDAEGVLGTGSTTAVLLADLADRSLLVADTASSSARYRMLQTVRSFATSQFEASGRSDAVRRRHARHIGTVLDEVDRSVRSVHEQVGRHRLDRIAPEVRSAHAWARANEPLLADAMCTALHLATYSSFWSEPEEWAESLISTDPGSATPGAHLLLAGAAASRGELDLARAHARTAREAGDDRVIATAWEILADVAIYGGDYDGTIEATDLVRNLASVLDDPHLDAIGLVDRALAEAFLGDPAHGLALVDGYDPDRCSISDRGWLMYTRGELLRAVGDPEAARTFASAVEMALHVGNHFVGSVAKQSLATELARAGRTDRALETYAECLHDHLRHGNITHGLTTLRNLVELVHARGDTETAVRLAGATTSEVQTSSAPTGSSPTSWRTRASFGAEAERLPGVFEHMQDAVGSEQFAEWWCAGAALDEDAAMRLALRAVERCLGRSASAS